MKKFAIVGQTLAHTFSPQIHTNFFANNNIEASYEICEIALSEFDSCKDRLKKYDGFNVTVPYKEKIVPLLDSLDKTAEQIGAVNTVVNSGGKLIGYNTDFYGVKYMLESNNINVEGKNICVLGSGGACKAVLYYLIVSGASSITIVSRDAESARAKFTESNLSKLNYLGVINCASYEELNKISGYLLINTTPVGMFPNNSDCPITDKQIFNFQNICDLIYNPCVTKLCLNAMSNAETIVNGLSMLIAQGIKAEELWGNKCDIKEEICRIYKVINAQFSLNDGNIVFLSGMMGCGKTTVGKLVAEKLGMTFIDLDEQIVKENNISIAQMFEKGNDYFRQCESETLRKCSQMKNIVISLGGGAVLKDKNCAILKLVGTTFFVNRDINIIAKTIDSESRPLIRDNPQKLMQIYNERIDRYKSSCNFIVENNDTAEECVNTICEIIDSIKQKV